MKKKRLFSQVGGALLALALVVSMCVSPVASVDAEAAEGFQIVALNSGDNLEFTEGDVIDTNSWFDVQYNGVAPYNVYGCYNGVYYTNVEKVTYYVYDSSTGMVEVDSIDDAQYVYAPYKSILTLTYMKEECDEDGNTEWTEIEENKALNEVGKYRVTASLKVSSSTGYEYYYVYEENNDNYVAAFYDNTISSQTIEYTIKAKEAEDPEKPEEPSDDPVEEAAVEIRPNAAEGYKVAPGTDMSQYFALWDKEYSTMINYMYDSQNTSYGWYNSVSDVFDMSYTDENGESVAETPTTPGVYYAKASLPKDSYMCYILQNNAWVTPAPVYTVSGDVSATLKYEVVADGATADLVVSADIPETVKAGTDMAPYFTYTFRGREVELLYQDPDGTYENYKTYIANPTEDDLNYGYLAQEDAFVMHYYKLDKDGNVLEDLGSEVPEEAGTYKVTAELTDYTEDGGFYTVYVLWTGSNDTSEYYDYYGGVIGEGIYTIEAADEPVEEPDEPVVDPDEPVVDPDEPVVDPDEPSKGDTDTDVDDTNDVTTDKDKTADTTKTSDSTKTSAKTGDTTPLALYIVLIVACGIVVAAMVQRRRKNA